MLEQLKNQLNKLEQLKNQMNKLEQLKNHKRNRFYEGFSPITVGRQRKPLHFLKIPISCDWIVVWFSFRTGPGTGSDLRMHFVDTSILSTTALEVSMCSCVFLLFGTLRVFVIYVFVDHFLECM